MYMMKMTKMLPQDHQNPEMREQFLSDKDRMAGTSNIMQLMNIILTIFVVSGQQ